MDESGDGDGDGASGDGDGASGDGVDDGVDEIEVTSFFDLDFFADDMSGMMDVTTGREKGVSADSVTLEETDDDEIEEVGEDVVDVFVVEAPDDRRTRDDDDEG